MREELQGATVAPRQAFVQLLRALPPEGQVYRTMSKTFTAGELAELLEAGDEVAKIWISETLRVARDVVARQAEHRRKAPPRVEDDGPQLPDTRLLQPRRAFLSLLSEVPEDKLVYRNKALCAFTAAQISMMLEANDPEAEGWLSAVLDIVRDYIVKTALGERE